MLINSKLDVQKNGFKKLTLFEKEDQKCQTLFDKEKTKQCHNQVLKNKKDQFNFYFSEKDLTCVCFFLT